VVIDGASTYEPFSVAGGATLTLQNLTVQHGSVTGSAGGAFNQGTLNVFNSTFRDNTATVEGGAIDNLGTLVVANSTFTGNSSIYGGGIVNNGGTATILNSTFSGNTASTHGGAFSTSNDATSAVQNSIMGNSAAVDDCWNGGGGFTGDHNIIENPSSSTSACGIPSTADPQVDSLTGSPAYFPLLGTSPALGAGNDAVCTAAPVSNRDQRGLLRPQGTHCDIGAFERGVGIFADVPVPGKEWMQPWIEAFYAHGITTGCNPSPLMYCPENNVTRAEMAVFLLRAKHGMGYAPPTPTHDFADVPVTGKEWMEPWIEQFYAEGITTGCGGGNYCPENNVTRAEMAVFVLRALHGGGYTPPALSHFFSDMPVSGKEWMEPWVDEFKREGVTTGCGAGNYCPENNVTRAEMAVFIGRAYHLYP
jgi:predicted outer membrane repeat protein